LLTVIFRDQHHRHLCHSSAIIIHQPSSLILLIMNEPGLEWMQASIVEPQPVYYARHTFASTKRGNKVSKSCVLCGSDNIGVKGRTILESGSVIRGDLSTIELGSYCVLGKGAVLRPPEQTFQGRIAHIPMTIGDHVIIEENAIVEAAAIGECTRIGKKAMVGPRCIISPCTLIVDGSVLAANSVTAPFSIWSGCPARPVGRLPESWARVWMEHTREFYKNFLPQQQTQPTTTNQPTRSASSASTQATTSMEPAPTSARPASSSSSSSSSISQQRTPTSAASTGKATTTEHTPLPPIPDQQA